MVSKIQTEKRGRRCLAEYRYTAADINGKTVKGKTAAGNPEQLKDSLLKQKLFMLEYDEIHKSAGKRLKAKQLADFCRELSSMLATGVSLVRAMQIIINRELPPQMKATFASLNNLIKRGVALSEAMEQQGEVFPGLLINMVKAGEANGKLDESLEKMAQHYEAEHRTNQDIKGAMTYPVILIVITVIVIIAVFTFIFPSFMGIFGDMELPLITQIMMGISDFLTQQWLLAIVVRLENLYSPLINRNCETLFLSMTEITNVLSENSPQNFTRRISPLTARSIDASFSPAPEKSSM